MSKAASWWWGERLQPCREGKCQGQWLLRPPAGPPSKARCQSSARAGSVPAFLCGTAQLPRITHAPPGAPRAGLCSAQPSATPARRTGKQEASRSVSCCPKNWTVWKGNTEPKATTPPRPKGSHLTETGTRELSEVMDRKGRSPKSTFFPREGLSFCFDFQNEIDLGKSHTHCRAEARCKNTRVSIYI